MKLMQGFYFKAKKKKKNYFGVHLDAAIPVQLDAI